MPNVMEVKELTQDAFKHFGHLIGIPDRPPDVAREYLSWWGGLYDFEFEDTASLGFLSISRTPFEITSMERHLKAVEVFIPLRGIGVLPFAIGVPADSLADPNAVAVAVHRPLPVRQIVRKGRRLANRSTRWRGSASGQRGRAVARGT